MYSFKYKDLAGALYGALVSDPFIAAIAEQIPGNASDKKLALMCYMDYSMVEAEMHGRLYIPDGQQYGASIWATPLSAGFETEKDANKKAFIAQHLGPKALETWLSMTGFMHHQLNGVIAADTWYLSIVGIDPKFQGQGLGAGLIAPVLNDADKLGVASYLETFSPKTINFYNRLGYKVALEITEPVTGVNYWALVREPLSN